MRQVSIFFLSSNTNNSCYSQRRLFSRRCKCQLHSSIHCSFTLISDTLTAAIALKDSRSNIGSLAESLQMSHVCGSCYRSSFWHTHTHTHKQAPRSDNLKWQSFPVDTCRPIYACLKQYHSIPSLFYRVNHTAKARIGVITNKPLRWL